MNKTLRFAYAILSLFLVSCIAEEAPQVEQEATTLTVGLTDVQTKTYLAEEAEDGYRSVLWDEGDVINVNGSDSSPLTAEQAGFRFADFTFYNTVAPFNVIYPASIYECKASDLAEENVPANTTIINIPVSQKYSPTSFGKGAAILYGYTDKGNSSVELKDLCAAVKITLKKGTDILKSAQVLSNSKSSSIAGKYALDTQTGKYEVLEGVHAVSLEIDEMSLEDGDKSFYFTIPYGSYPEGFTIKFYNKENFPMECKWLKMPGAETAGINIESGKLYEFKPVEFSLGSREVLTGEEWKYLAECINAKNSEWQKKFLDQKTNTIRLGADLVLPEGTPQITEDFKYILDGQNNSIINPNASAALIMTLPKGGAIRNLTIEGEFNVQDAAVSQIEASTFVHSLSDGEIVNCVNKMEINVLAQTVIFGTFAKTVTSGKLVNCVNKADLNINMDASTRTSGAPKSFGGGLVANVFGPTGVALFDNCVNSGNVTITLKVGDAGGVGRAGFAGILGYVHGAKADKYPHMINCTNEGQVRLMMETTPQSTTLPKAQYSVGGIVGLAAELAKSGGKFECSALDKEATNCYLIMENCRNTALIQNNAVSSVASTDYTTKIYTGGLAGTLLGMKENPAKIINCVNTGEVVPYSVNVDPYYRSAVCGVCGGLIGVGGNVDIEGGEINAKVGSSTAHTFSTAGVLGLALSKFSIKGLKVKTDIVRIAAKDISPDDHALAVTSNTSKYKVDLKDSEISGCSFDGSFSLYSTKSYDTRKAENKPQVPSTLEPVTKLDIESGQKIVATSYTNEAITLKDNVFGGTVNQ